MDSDSQFSRQNTIILAVIVAAVWLIVVGLPWTAALTPFLLAGLPVLIGQMVAVAAPLLNIAILVWLCRRAGSRE